MNQIAQKNADNNNNNGEIKKKWKFKQKPRELTPQEQKWKKIAFWILGLFLFLFIGQILFYAIFYDINDWVGILIIFIVLVMPAYLANAGMLIMGGGKPIDGGKIAKDGRPLFGPGKTWRGFILGPLVWGIIVALAIHSIFYFTWDQIEQFIIAVFSDPNRPYDFIDRSPQEAIDLYKLYLLGGYSNETFSQCFIRLVFRVTCVAYAAAFGDLIGSWLKRRLDRKRGEPFWIIDQIDFIICVLLVAMPFIQVNIDYLAIVIFSLIFTPSLTIFSNALTYFLGHKSVPW
ncbi:MAG: CDP-archaeol synthase [Promethearchaeota archaeon]